MSFFSTQKEKFNCHLIFEKNEDNNYKNYVEKFKEYNIQVHKPISSFSLIRIFSTIRSLIRINKIIKENCIDLVHILFATPNAFWGLFIKKPYIIKLFKNSED